MNLAINDNTLYLCHFIRGHLYVSVSLWHWAYQYNTITCIYMIKINGTFSFQLLVLKYVQNKDVFMRYHKAHLTRRLILDTSADNEKEENMVEWLRVSNYYTAKLLLTVIR